MKDFLKNVLATVVGMFVICIVFSILSLLTLAGLASMDTETASVEDNSVMVIKLEGDISDRVQSDPISEIMGEPKSASLIDMLAAIKNAKDNDAIKGIYLDCGNLSGATPAGLEELHDALVDFKTSGKFILSYADNYTQGQYYLCSTADSVVLNPQGMVELAGLASQTIYYKKVLDKIGVKMQIFKVGTYKSAVEPYILEDMSEANREQIECFSGEIWGQMLKDISKSRKMKAEVLNALVDSSIVFKPTDYLLKHKIIDKVAFRDEVPQIIANMMKCDKNDYNTASVTTVASVANNTPKSMSGDIVAVYYAGGEIVQESSAQSFASGEQIVGCEVVKDLKKLADDDDVKAVVLRVNSPGGSAYASEQIWHQVMNIKSKKPIVVSMSGYAASGGYYISCAADWIVAEPNTLTGSIGIFGQFPDASELLTDKIGLNFATVKTNEYADFGTMGRAMNSGESALLQAYINNGYELFTKRCAEGRGLSQDSIKVIGEGRVWTGAHAKKIGLVDQLGSLADAIAVAKKRAKIEECTIQSYPAEKSFMEKLLDKASGEDIADAKLKESLGEYYDMFRSVKDIQKKDNIQAALPYYLKFNL